MNAQRDYLFSNARKLLNNRFKRTWIDIGHHLYNPTDKAYKADQLTDESKFCKQLQSVVLSENHNKNKFVDWQELDPDAFWEYLYSDQWNEATSLRVFQGELLETLFMALNKLEGDGETATYTTYAFANNIRSTRKVPSEDDKSKITYQEETLNISFTFYGRTNSGVKNTYEEKMKTKAFCPPRHEPSPVHHTKRLSLSVPEECRSDIMMLSQIFNESNQESARRRQSLTNENRPDSIEEDHAEKSHLSTDEFSDIDELDERSGSNDMTSGRATANAMFLKKMKKNRYIISTVEYGVPLYESEYDGDKKKKHTPLGFMSTYNMPPGESVSILPLSCKMSTATPTKDINVESCITKPIEDDDNFYLNTDAICNRDKFETSMELLRKRRLVVEKRRAEQRKIKEMKKMQMERRELPPLIDDPIHVPIPLMKTVPTFEEMAHIIAEDNKIDPRNNKAKAMMGKRFALRKNNKKKLTKKKVTGLSGIISVSPNTSTPHEEFRTSKSMENTFTNKEKFADGIYGVTDCQPFKQTILEDGTLFRQKRRGTIADPLQTLKEFNNAMRSRRDYLAAKPVHAPCVLLVSPSGITECIRKVPKVELQRPSQFMDLPNTGNERRSSEMSNTGTQRLYSRMSNIGNQSRFSEVSTTGNQRRYSEVSNMGRQRRNSKVSSTVNQRRYSEVSNAGVSKMTSSLRRDINTGLGQSTIYDSNSDSDDDPKEEHDTAEVFDTNKLNKQWSFQKLRTKQNVQKKKPVFYSILKRFFRVQLAADTFATGVPSQGEQTAKSHPERRRMSLAQGVQAILMKSRQRPKFVVGHVRRFSKNISKNAKPPTPVKISPPSFYTVSYNDFIQKLMKSMDDFVVRKEIVTSSINFETVTTVTFTRISASSFQAKLRESITK